MTTIATANPKLSMNSPNTTFIPIDMKNIDMKSSFIGSTLSNRFILNLDLDKVTPIRNAPTAMESPTMCERYAKPKQSPTDTMRRTSCDVLSPIQSRIRGMNLTPIAMMTIMNTMIFRMSVVISDMPIVPPAKIGVTIDRMMT